MGDIFTIAGIMRLLQAVGPVTAALPAFREVYDQIVETFSSKSDQDTLKTAYQELQSENSGGHARLQKMLKQAEAAE